MGLHRRNSLIQPSSAKIMIGLMIMFMAISMVSAFDFDNILGYNDEGDEVIITNAFGLGEVIAKVETQTSLKNNIIFINDPEVCESYDKINGMGRNCLIAEYTIDSFQDYDNALGEDKFYNIKKDKKEIQKDYIRKYKVEDGTKLIPDNTKETCTILKNESIKCLNVNSFKSVPKYKWILKEDTNIKQEVISIGIFTNVAEGEHTDWVPKFFGKYATEWLDFTGALRLEYNVAVSSNDDMVYDDNVKAMGFKQGLYGIDGDYEIQGVSLAFQKYNTPTCTYTISITHLDGSGWPTGAPLSTGTYDASTAPAVQAFVNISMSAYTLVNDTEYAIVVNDTSAGCDSTNALRFYMSGDVQTAPARWMRSTDGGANWNSPNGNDFRFIIWGSAPITSPDVTLNSPDDYANYSTTSVTLNCSATDDGTVENISLIVDGSISTTVNGGFLQQLLTASDGSHTWNCNSTDDNNEEGTGTQRTFTIDTTPAISFDGGTPDDYFNSSSTDFTMNVSFTETYFENITFSLYNSSGTEIETDFYDVIENKVDENGLDDGTYTYNVTICTTTNQCNTTETRTITIDTTYPLVDIVYPTNTTYVTSNIPYNVSLNYTASDTNLETCWYNNETANITIACGTNTSIMVGEGSHTFIVYANDSVGWENSSSQTFFVNYYYENASYDNALPLGETDTIALNITATSIDTFNGTLYYNSIAQTTSYSNTATKGLMSSDVIATPVGNSSLYWDYWLNGINYNSSTYYQTVMNVTPAVISNTTCAGGLTLVREFNFAQEVNKTRLLGMSVNYIFRMGVSNSSSVTSKGSLVGNVVNVCINTTVSDTYNIGYGELQYEKTGFSDRRYYTFSNDQLINGTVINNTLYSLVSGSSTSFLFTIKDAGLTLYEGVYLSLNRWFPEDDEYKVSEMSKTDDKGQTVMKVEVEDTDYRVGVYYPNGTLIYLAEPIRFVCIASPCTYSLTVPSDAGDDYENWNDLTYLIEFNTDTFTMTYNDPNQDTSLIRLDVFKNIGTGESLICTDNATSYTGVLTCNVSAYTGQLRAVAYRTASPEISIAVLFADIRSTALAGDNGLFVTLIMMILLVMIGITSPILAVILSVLAFIPAIAFGIIPLSIGLILCAMSFIVIHFMKRGAGQ